MPHNKTWILVANSSHAKVFQLNQFPKLKAVATLTHPESRLHDQDLVSDGPGRTFDRMGMGRHSYESKTDPKDVEIEKFAKDLIIFLENAFKNGEFTKLYLWASPSFLGLLREKLPHAIKETIAFEGDKDLTDQPTEAIESSLQAIIF